MLIPADALLVEALSTYSSNRAAVVNTRALQHELCAMEATRELFGMRRNYF